MRISIFLTILFLTLLASCKQDDRRSVSESQSTENDIVSDGVVKTYDEQNKLYSEVTYKDGLKHGIARLYYSSGVLSDEIMYQNDEKHGLAKKFHKNGKIYSLTPYFQGKKEGIQKKFYSSGNLWAETPYRKGMPGIGLKEYNRNGSLRDIYPRIEVQKFHRNGKIILHVFLSNHSKNVVFYNTKLVEGTYIPPRARPVFAESGIARIEIAVEKGRPIDQTVSLVAKYRTKDHNIFVTQKNYRVLSK